MNAQESNCTVQRRSMSRYHIMYKERTSVRLWSKIGACNPLNNRLLVHWASMGLSHWYCVVRMRLLVNRTIAVAMFTALRNVLV